MTNWLGFGMMLEKKPAHAAPKHKRLTPHSCSLARMTSEVNSSSNTLMETRMFDIINPVTKDYVLEFEHCST